MQWAGLQWAVAVQGADSGPVRFGDGTASELCARTLALSLQVMETKDAAVRDELYEEAQLLRRRQQDYKSELVGLPGGPAD